MANDKYRLANNVRDNVWLNTETGESFTDDDKQARVYRDMQTWLAAGNEIGPPASIVNPARPARGDRIKQITTAGRAALASAPLVSDGEKALGTIFGQMLNALEALDVAPPPQLPQTPVPPPKANPPGPPVQLGPPPTPPSGRPNGG